IPLCTTAISFVHAECGCALLSVTPPCVAHLVCPIPICPCICPNSSDLFTSTTLPTPFRTRMLPPVIVAIPTLSYPLYSIFLRLSINIGAACEIPLYPIIEHTRY